MYNKEFAKAIQDSINDPTGVIRYLEANEEIGDIRHEETMQLNKKVLYVSVIACVASVISVALTLLQLVLR